MKLRNKKTGDIVDIADLDFTSDDFAIWLSTTKYTSLAELNAEWEDYEEPKGYWFIECAAPYPVDFCEFNEDTEDDKKIGNYFETKEEAEKAVEKLKSWKRLKDNGFKFEGIEKRGHHINFYQGRSYETDKQCQQAMKDLDLLFGGEG